MRYERPGIGSTFRSEMRWSVDVETGERHRVLNGWTLGELASRSHLDPSTVGDMVARRRQPTFGTIQAVRTALGLEMADVIKFFDDLPTLADEGS